MTARKPSVYSEVVAEVAQHLEVGDSTRLDALTRGGLLVMGPTTWRTWGRPLLGRVCVVSRKPSSDLFTDAALRNVASVARENERVWICGGAEVYKLALQINVVDVIDLTIIPAVDPLPLVGSEPVRLRYFPANLLEGWGSVKETRYEEDSRLTHRRYDRKQP